MEQLTPGAGAKTLETHGWASRGGAGQDGAGRTGRLLEISKLSDLCLSLQLTLREYFFSGLAPRLKVPKTEQRRHRQ